MRSNERPTNHPKIIIMITITIIAMMMKTTCYSSGRLTGRSKKFIFFESKIPIKQNYKYAVNVCSTYSWSTAEFYLLSTPVYNKCRSIDRNRRRKGPMHVCGTYFSFIIQLPNANQWAPWHTDTGATNKSESEYKTRTPFQYNLSLNPKINSPLRTIIQFSLSPGRW